MQPLQWSMRDTAETLVAKTHRTPSGKMQHSAARDVNFMIFVGYLRLSVISTVDPSSSCRTAAHSLVRVCETH